MLRGYVSHNKLIPGSILQIIINMNISPITSMFGIQSQCKSHILQEDGLADTLNNLLLQDNYIKPWSHEYSMVKLLTRSFELYCYIVLFYELLVIIFHVVYTCFTDFI